MSNHERLVYQIFTAVVYNKVIVGTLYHQNFILNAPVFILCNTIPYSKLLFLLINYISSSIMWNSSLYHKVSPIYFSENIIFINEEISAYAAY